MTRPAKRVPLFKAAPKRHKITHLTLKEFSAVRKPAMAGATIDLTKADTRLILIEKATPAPADVHVPVPGAKPPIKKPGYKPNPAPGSVEADADIMCAACGAPMTKSDDDHPHLTEQQMNELEKAKADLAAAVAKAEQAVAQQEILKADLAKAQKFGLLTDIEKAHWKRLPANDADKFIGMTHTERAEEMKPVYTSTATGAVFTKADDSRTIDMAKALDTDRATMQTELAKARDAGMEARVTVELAHLPGTVQERAALMKAVEGISDEKIRTGAVAALKAHDAILGKAFQRSGAGQTAIVKSGSAEDRLDQAVKKHATDNKVTVEKAYEAVLETAEGMALYSEIEQEAKGSRQARPPGN